MDEQEIAKEDEDPLEVSTYQERVREMVDLNADSQDPLSDLKPHERPK